MMMTAAVMTPVSTAVPTSAAMASASTTAACRNGLRQPARAIKVRIPPAALIRLLFMVVSPRRKERCRPPASPTGTTTAVVRRQRCVLRTCNAPAKCALLRSQIGSRSVLSAVEVVIAAQRKCRAVTTVRMSRSRRPGSRGPWGAAHRLRTSPASRGRFRLRRRASASRP